MVLLLAWQKIGITNQIQEETHICEQTIDYGRSSQDSTLWLKTRYRFYAVIEVPRFATREKEGDFNIQSYGSIQYFASF